MFTTSSPELRTRSIILYFSLNFVATRVYISLPSSLSLFVSSNLLMMLWSRINSLHVHQQLCILAGWIWLRKELSFVIWPCTYSALFLKTRYDVRFIWIIFIVYIIWWIIPVWHNKIAYSTMPSMVFHLLQFIYNIIPFISYIYIIFQTWKIFCVNAKIISVIRTIVFCAVSVEDSNR